MVSVSSAERLSASATSTETLGRGGERRCVRLPVPVHEREAGLHSEDEVPALVPLDDTEARGPTWERLEDQVAWYDRKSMSAQRAYKRLKIAELVLASGVPVVAGTSMPRTLIGVLGAAVVVLEGVQHLFQWQQNWILYRSTAEALKHERYLFLAQAGPYTTQDRTRVLAERIEGLISQEHAKWTESREQSEIQKRSGR